MVALTQTPVDYDAVTTCDYCLKEAVARHVTRLVLHGVVLDVCNTDLRYLAHSPMSVRVRALRYLVRTYRTAA